MNQWIKAYQKDHELVKDMDAHLADREGFHIWWLGQSGFLLQWQGKRVLIDPYLSDSLTKKYQSTDKPHVRMSERVIDPELLRNINVVTSSHNHTDHLDAETLQPVLKNNPGIQFIIPEANRQFVAERVGCKINFPRGLNDGEAVEVEGFTFHGIPASHNTIERDENGRCRFMGYVIRFGKFAIYHSGDTVLFDDLVSLLRPFHPDLALLPINGNDPARGVAGNLDGAEAAQLARYIGARCVIPCHYHLFLFNTADVKEFEAAATKLAQPYTVLQLGERWDGQVISLLAS